MFQILAPILVFIGYLIGVKLLLVAQVAIIIAVLLFINSSFVQGEGMVGVIYMVGALCVFLGIGIGDVIYLIAHGIPPNIHEALRWLVSI